MCGVWVPLQAGGGGEDECADVDHSVAHSATCTCAQTLALAGARHMYISAAAKYVQLLLLILLLLPTLGVMSSTKKGMS